MNLEFKTVNNHNKAISLEILKAFNHLINNDLNPITQAERLTTKFSTTITLNNFQDVFSQFQRDNLQIINESSVNEFEFENQERVLFKMLQIFLFYLKYHLDLLPDEDIQAPKFHGLNRIAAPPKEAYKYSGHNKMDILDSKKGHALLLD